MNRITLDTPLRERLNGLKEPFEVFDEQGRKIGLFLPEEVYRSLLYRLAEAQCPFSAEQLQSMRQEANGQTLADFWKNRVPS
jgi:hypothetical protein